MDWTNGFFKARSLSGSALRTFIDSGIQNLTQNCLNCKFIQGCPVIEAKASRQYEFEIDSLVLGAQDPLPRLRAKALYFFRKNGRLVLSVYVIKAKSSFATHEKKSSRNTAR
jgi:precorrin-6B methylase 2